MRGAVVALGLCAAAASAHDLTADVSSSLTTSSDDNPRAGSAGINLSGSFDFNERWSAWLGASYAREFGTRSAEVSASGSNVFTFNAGALFLPSDHFLLMASLNGSPPTPATNALHLPFTRADGTEAQLNVVMNSTNGAFGGTLVGGWMSGGDSNWEHGIDVSAGAMDFITTQSVNVAGTTGGPLLRAYCRTHPRVQGCALLDGVTSNLVQVRLGAAYTATLFSKLDVALDGAAYLYSADPTQVGYFSVFTAGRLGGIEVGNGVPVAPFVFTARPSVLYRFEKVTVKLAYQFGLYAGTTGLNHTATVRVGIRIVKAFKLNLTVTAQMDSSRSGLSNFGGTAVVGGVVSF